ncbi:MAG: M13 family metallopeptidase [Candidatus Eisenbacteria bacterium]|nr:M13 family metallopeptidase [Candidatus Eisenbacteria bacterium]
MTLRRLPIALAGLLLAACTAASPGVSAEAHHGVNAVYMDTTCAACRDFFTFANGAWYKTAEIPPSYTGIGAGRELVDRNTEVLHRVLEDTRSKMATETDVTIKKLASFYSTCMDSDRAEREGARPIQPELNRISAIRDRAGLVRHLAHLTLIGQGVPFHLGGEADLKNSSMNLAYLDQGGLGLPERDYYTRTDSTSVALRNDYVAHIGRMLQLIGTPADEASKSAAAILAFETGLANASMGRVQMRDPDAIYHKMAVKDLVKLAPGMQWTQFFGDVGVAELTKPAGQLSVDQPDFAKYASAQVGNAPLETWKAYLRYHLLANTASTLNQALFTEDFTFNSKLTGQRVPLPRWKRCSAGSDAAMGEALGKAYVATEFPPSAKAHALELVNNLQITLRERIAKLDWMSDSTKAQAVKKLDVVLKKIGYPDQWRDYTKLVVSADSSFAVNAIHARSFVAKRYLDRIGKPVDRTEWGMSPPTVNAYYNPLINEIVFPAGIMQPPNFDLLADDAFNYGGMGMVIGHEMTHGFDDEGRKFDSRGNRSDWWTAEDGKRFEARAQKVVDQYNGYVAVDTLHVNGKLTLGENIADLGGVTIAYYAYQRSLEGKPRVTIDGYTPEQRFFLGFAQAWRRKVRPESERLRTLTDPHSPARWRVNGPLSNLPEFQKAWGCKGGEGMVRGDQITIW